MTKPADQAVQILPPDQLLTAAAFQRLADVPPEIEWFANLGNKATRRAYENALQDFMRFTGIARPDEFRSVTRAHVIAWRDELVQRNLSGMTVRHRLAALSSLFEYLCERNTVTHNPVKGARRHSGWPVGRQPEWPVVRSRRLRSGRRRRATGGAGLVGSSMAGLGLETRSTRARHPNHRSAGSPLHEHTQEEDAGVGRGQDRHQRAQCAPYRALGHAALAEPATLLALAPQSLRPGLAR